MRSADAARQRSTASAHSLVPTPVRRNGRLTRRNVSRASGGSYAGCTTASPVEFATNVPAEQEAAVLQCLAAEPEFEFEAVRPVPARLPLGDLRHGERPFAEAPVDHLVLDLDMLRTVDQADELDITGGKQPHHRNHRHRVLPPLAAASLQYDTRHPRGCPLGLAPDRRTHALRG